MSREGIPKLIARRISSFALLPRTQHYIALSNPIKECVAVGPQHNVLAQSPLVWGVWLQRCNKVTAPGDYQGGLSIRSPFPSPSLTWCCCDTQTHWTSGGSSSLIWIKGITSLAFTPRLSSLHTAGPSCPCL